MNIFSIKSVVAGLMVIALLVYSSFTPKVSLPVDGQVEFEVAQVGGLDLTHDQQRANALVQTLPLQDVLGSLAPIALSPFFALTCLSGASLLGDAGLLPDSISDNFMMGANSPLNNETVFIGLLFLTLLTAAPKLTKVSKPFAQAVDQLEAYSGIVAAIAVQFLSQVGVDEPTSREVAMVYSAGIITASYSTLLMVFSAINIFVVNSVKFFCEVMILISPIPTVDAIFEAINKAFAAFLIAVYLISPWAATFLNLLIFLVSLAVFAWTYRRVVFMRCVLADPFFGWIAEAIFRMRGITENSTKLPKSVRIKLPDPTVVLKAFAGRKMKGIKRKARGYLVHSGGMTYFVKPRMIGKDRIVELGGDERQMEVRAGFFSHSVVIRNAAGETIQKILFTKRYNNVLDRIHGALHAQGSGIKQSSNLSDFGKSFSDSIKSRDRTSMRSELT